MESLKELYKIGPGPSSSHTIGPLRACQRFKKEVGSCDEYIVDLYGSLSLTGKGHYTDQICIQAFAPAKTTVYFHDEFLPEHANIMEIRGIENQKEKAYWKVASIGGGSIRIINLPKENMEVYKENTFEEIFSYCTQNHMNLVDYVLSYEPDIKDYLKNVWKAMNQCIARGLEAEGELPGRLHFPRMAKAMYAEAKECNDPIEIQKNYVTAYAFAAAEENASLHEVVTAPTLGSCGVLPAVLKYYHEHQNVSEDKIIEALAVAGIFGNIVKTNATISGAEGGCQAEIGVACAMASSAISYLKGLPLIQISNAAEIGIEHHLGLTCDPVGGYVIIPCIERNGVAALRAIDNAHYASILGKNKRNFVDFDTVVRTMRQTGMKLPVELKETSLAGLASEVKIN